MKSFLAVIHLTAILMVAYASADDGVVVDIVQDGASQRWIAAHDVDEIRTVEDGFSFVIRGDDPYVVSPVFELPIDKPWLMKLKISSSRAGTAQLFFFQDEATEKDSVRFPVTGRGEEEIVFPLPRIGFKSRFRFDPPGYPGFFVVKDAKLIERNEWSFPVCASPNLSEIETPVIFESDSEQRKLTRIHQDPKDIQRFDFWFDDKRLAVNHNLLPIGYLLGSKAKWFTPSFKITHHEEGESFIEFAGQSIDPDGTAWYLTRRFERSKSGIVLHTKYSCSTEREVIFAPMLMLLAGSERILGERFQSIFPGLEYLENEPSSSSRDIEGLAAERRVPLSYKITIPCMATFSDGQWVSLSWKTNPNIAAFFDFPARTFAIDANSFGLIMPGANGATRVDGEVLPFKSLKIGKDQVVEATCTINAGNGTDITGAIANWLEYNPLPTLPEVNRKEYLEAVCEGWTSPALGTDGLFRHAIGVNFPPQPALDAAAMIEWLSNSKTLEQRKRESLLKLSKQAREGVPTSQAYTSRIGHLQRSLGSLFPEVVAGAIEQARTIASESLIRFDERSIAEYTPSPGNLDYSRNHTSKEVNGVAAERVVSVLNAALFSGDRDLINQALQRVRWLDRWDHSVPRGAQYWEIPIHTPDLLAVAYLTKAYALAYSIDKDPRLLLRAKQWALCGLPFIYLSAPTENAIGPYASIAVYGATTWISPVWIGLPVQWCGLVYADALYELSESDSSGRWKAIADGIVLSAMQQTYPAGHERAGMLPDSFDLNAQIRNPFDINPGTLQPLALPLVDHTLTKERLILRGSKVICYAPGNIDVIEDNERKVVLRVKASVGATALFHALKRIREVKIDGRCLPKSEYLQIRGEQSAAVPLVLSEMQSVVELFLE